MNQEGIRFLYYNCIIVVYNNDYITVAIVELDSGVFWYLLGEILRIISRKKKWATYVFPSHNLQH